MRVYMYVRLCALYMNGVYVLYVTLGMYVLCVYIYVMYVMYAMSVYNVWCVCL